MHTIFRHLAGGVGHLVLLAGFSAFAIWYALDAWRAQAKVENMLLIGPVALIVLGIMAFQAARQIIRLRSEARAGGGADSDGPLHAPEADVGRVASLRARYGAPLSAIGLGLYVIALPLIGFDVATAVFVMCNMLLQGERNPFIIAAFSLLVATLPVIAIEAMLSVPVPTLVLP